MTEVSQTIHNHHAELTARLATEMTKLRKHSSEADGTALAEFLRSELLPHATGEERALYPALDPIIKQHGSPTATMRVDHEFIQRYVSQIAQTSELLKLASGHKRTALREQLYRLSLRLETLLEVHLAKEERVYLPLLERYVPEKEQLRILGDMHETPEAHDASAAQTLDVRDLPPAQRHARIFALFEALPAGSAFVLVNDHDPKPLYYQLNFEHSGQLVWDYLEEGPEAWRVRIGKAG